VRPDCSERKVSIAAVDLTRPQSPIGQRFFADFRFRITVFFFARSGSRLPPVSRLHSSYVSGEIFPSTSSSANFRRCAFDLNGMRYSQHRLTLPALRL